MAKTLIRNVYMDVVGSLERVGYGPIFGNADAVPTDVAARISNPAAWALTATSEAAMLALSATVDDVCIRTDLDPDGVFILTDSPASTLANWTHLNPLPELSLGGVDIATQAELEAALAAKQDSIPPGTYLDRAGSAQTVTTPVTFTGGFLLDLTERVDIRAKGASTGASAAANTAAILTAAAQAKANNSVLVFPTGTFTCNPNEIVLECHVDAQPGAKLQFGATAGWAVRLGVAATLLRGRRMRLPEIDLITETWAGNETGLEMPGNLENCEIHIPLVGKFSVGVKVAPVDGGLAYNTFYVGFLNDNKINWLVEPSGAGGVGGYANENVVIGGRFAHSGTPTHSVATADTRQIKIAAPVGGSLNGVNGWLFVKPSLEGATAEYHIESYGSQNRWLAARFEAPTTTPKVHWGVSGAFIAIGNIIDGGVDADKIVETRDVNSYANGVVNHGTGTGMLAQYRGGFVDFPDGLRAAKFLLGASGTPSTWPLTANSDIRVILQTLGAVALAGNNPLNTNGGRVTAGRFEGDSALYNGATAASATDQMIGWLLSGDSAYRWTVSRSGVESWGSGASGADVVQSRKAANVLGLAADDCYMTGKNVTGSRPSASAVGAGAQFFDTTLNKPIWSDGSNWLDAMANVV